MKTLTRNTRAAPDPLSFEIAGGVYAGFHGSRPARAIGAGLFLAAMLLAMLVCGLAIFVATFFTWINATAGMPLLYILFDGCATFGLMVIGSWLLSMLERASGPIARAFAADPPTR